MNVRELLDRIARVELRDRSDIVSGPDDAMWPDTLLLNYLNEGMSVVYRECPFVTRKINSIVNSDGTTVIPDGVTKIVRVTRIGESIVVTHSFNVMTNELELDKSLAGQEVEIEYVSAPYYSMSDMTQDIKLAPRWHQMIIDYVVHAALRNRDVDVESRTVAEQRLVSFYNYLTHMKNECMMSLHPSTTWSSV